MFKFQKEKCEFCPMLSRLCNKQENKCLLKDFINEQNNVLGCSSCGTKSIFLEWYKNDFHCPNCNHWGWSLNHYKHQ